MINESRVTPFDRDSGRARLPDETGFAASADGVRLAFDVYGSRGPTILLLPSAPIIHSRQWKAQVHYLARHYRVVAYDGRGNGRSDRPTNPASYHDDRFADDLEAVMDATDTPRAVLVGLCTDGVWRSVRFAATYPARVAGIVAFGIGVPRIAPIQPHYASAMAVFDEELPTTDGWAKLNRHYWRRDYADYARFFFTQMAPEPHSTKAIDDATGWALDTSVDVMLAEGDAPFDFDAETIEAACGAVTCPLLLVHGTEDACQRPARAHRLAELTGAPLVLVEGAGHMIPGRHPVLANLLIRQFVDSLPEVRA